MTTALLIVDFNNTVIRSLAVNSQLSHNGQVTGGLYGLIAQLVAKIRERRPTHIIFCTDKPPYIREQRYPAYKQDRKKQGVKPLWTAWISANKEMVKEFLELTKIPLWEVSGLEADDLIACLVRAYSSDFDHIYILSTDDDLYQLLDATDQRGTPNVTLLKASGAVTRDDFIKLYPGLEPADWTLVTAIAGTHNNIVGLPRVGIKTAVKWVNEQKQAKRFHPQIEIHQALIDANIPLIQLPLPGVPLVPVELTPPMFNPRKIIQFLSGYGIHFTHAMQQAFDIPPGFAL